MNSGRRPRTVAIDDAMSEKRIVDLFLEEAQMIQPILEFNVYRRGLGIAQ
jgi:hypothetical protein